MFGFYVLTRITTVALLTFRQIFIERANIYNCATHPSDTPHLLIHAVIWHLNKDVIHRAHCVVKVCRLLVLIKPRYFIDKKASICGGSGRCHKNKFLVVNCLNGIYGFQVVIDNLKTIILLSDRHTSDFTAHLIDALQGAVQLLIGNNVFSVDAANFWISL